MFYYILMFNRNLSNYLAYNFQYNCPNLLQTFWLKQRFTCFNDNSFKINFKDKNKWKEASVNGW